MDFQMSKIRILSGNALKIIAAISMFVDHFGIIFCPDVDILRILGRIAFPIFAFMIAEGCRYTRHRLRYFLMMSGMGIAYLIAFYVYSGVVYMSIFITFSLSIIMIYALQRLKEACFGEDIRPVRIIGYAVAFVAAVVLSSAMNELFDIDYGFFGSLAPVLVALCHKPENCRSAFFDKIDRLEISLLGLLVAIVCLYVVYGGVRIFALLSIPLLLLYSGKRGKANMKYFFYVFYPVHILALEGIYTLIQIIK